MVFGKSDFRGTLAMRWTEYRPCSCIFHCKNYKILRNEFRNNVLRESIYCKYSWFWPTTVENDPIFVGEFNSTVSSFLLFNSLKLESLRPLNTPLLNGQELIWGSSHLIFTFSAGLQSSFVENLKKIFSLHFLILPKNEFSLFIFSHQSHHNLLCSCFISALVLVVEIGKLNDQCEACHAIPKERQAQASGGQLSAKHTPCSRLSWFITLYRAILSFQNISPTTSRL